MSPGRKTQPTLRLGEEDELIRTFREYIGLERELENAKIQAASRPDFNVFDAFRIFDVESKGWVSITDLRVGLNEVGIYCSMDELELFFKRYDKVADR